MNAVTLILVIWVSGDLTIERQQMPSLPECYDLARTVAAISPLIKVYCSEMEGDLPGWRETYKKRRKEYLKRHPR